MQKATKINMKLKNQQLRVVISLDCSTEHFFQERSLSSPEPKNSANSVLVFTIASFDLHSPRTNQLLLSLDVPLVGL
jgi:hypothetical protein